MRWMDLNARDYWKASFRMVQRSWTWSGLLHFNRTIHLNILGDIQYNRMIHTNTDQWPSQSPDLNKCGNLWPDLKTDVHIHFSFWLSTNCSAKEWVKKNNFLLWLQQNLQLRRALTNAYHTFQIIVCKERKKSYIHVCIFFYFTIIHYLVLFCHRTS